ncbi:MAG: amidohydrolase family protein [Silvanigrellaceae bacterium]
MASSISFLPDVLSADSGERIVIRNALVLTMDCENQTEVESTSNVLLGAHKDCDIVIESGVIKAIGANAGANVTDARVIQGRGCVVMPGLVDSHTHPIFAGSRATETVLKAQGLSYEEVAARGGGIVVSMRATRSASAGELKSSYIQRARQAVSRGVVAWEAKTGYGLSVEQEMRMLSCLYEAHADENEKYPLPFMSPTLLGPHAASPELHGLDNYVQALIDAIPQFASLAQKHSSLKKVLPLAVDIFLERNYFTREQADRWLSAALQHGLDVHIHADEFSRSGGCESAIALAQRLEQNSQRKRTRGRVLSVDHLQYATDADLAKLQTLGVMPVVLPLTSFFSNIAYVEGRKLRSAGVRAAIASDFNPGSAPLNSLWFASFLALVKGGFAVPEVLTGVTRNAAWAMGIENSHGVLKVGRRASLLMFEGNVAEDFFASPMGDHIKLVMV